jgi:hypothetical protein
MLDKIPTNAVVASDVVRRGPLRLPCAAVAEAGRHV